MRNGTESDGLLIGAWHGLEPGGVTLERANRVRNCGIDFIHTYHVQGDELERAYNVCDEAGLGCISYDALLSGGTEYLPKTLRREEAVNDAERVRRHLDRYAGHRSYWGVMLMDEPSCDHFTKMRAMRDLYRDAAPEKCCFINLFPAYATLRQLDGSTAEAIGCDSYEQYVAAYIDTVQPDFLSYDYYPLLIKEGKPAVMPTYLHNFEVVSRACRQNGLPFWFFIQCIGFNHFFKFPTLAELRWQTYCALAFGMRVLQLFCYTTPPNVNGEFYDYALEDRDGNVTPLYEEVRSLIRELRAFDRSYVSYRHIGVRYCAGTRPGIEQSLCLQPEDCVPLLSVSSDYPVLIGCFAREDGRRALLLADLSLPWEEVRNEVRLRLANVTRVRVHQLGRLYELEQADGVYTVTLLESGGCLLELG